MASGDTELKDGFKLPGWMKTKPTREFEPFAGSPPAPEDSFFYMRYPKTDMLFGKTQPNQDTSTIISEHTKDITTVVKERDWSKHTKPCQEVLHGIAPINTAANPLASPKPAGTDDGYKENAACGTSVLKVATQMISTRTPRGFTVASPEDDEPMTDAQRYRLMSRRGSKSLPTTPAHSPNGSPTSRRKFNGNRFFTSPYEQVEEANHRSWLTMALLGFKKDLTTSTSTLAEEDSLEVRLQANTLAESVENLGPAPRNKEPNLMNNEMPTQQPKLAKPVHAFRPKPTELREMNFWSPTSM